MKMKALFSSVLYYCKRRLKDDHLFIFWVSLVFYLSLYFNPNNKTLIVFFFLYLIILFLKFKNLTEILFFGFVASLSLTVGKTYSFELIPASQLFRFKNPVGYNINFVVSLSNILAVFLIPQLLKLLIRLIRLKKIYLDISDYLMIVLLLVFFFSSLNSKNPQISLLFFLQYLEIPIAFFSSKYLISLKGKRQRNIFLFLLFAQAIFQTLWVVLQLAKGGPLGRSIESASIISPFGEGADEDFWWYRPAGTFGHPNSLAAFLIPPLILSFANLFIEKQERIREKIYYLAAFFSAFLGIVVTLGRSAWIAAAFGFVSISIFLRKKPQYHFIVRRDKKILRLSVIFLIIASFFVIPRLLASFNTFTRGGGFNIRTEQIQSALQVIAENPFWGTGLGMSVPEMLKNDPRGIFYYHPTLVHNWYIRLATEVGLLALLVTILLLNSCLRVVFFVKGGKEKAMSFTLTVTIIAMLINGIFQPYFGSETLFYIFLGSLYALKDNS